MWHVTVTPVASGTYGKHNEGKNKRNFSAIILLMIKYDCYAGTTAKTHRTHHFTTLNHKMHNTLP
jgi:hypothetical protein